jgi:glyoxylase-like metal-dependent hydrolase (beta-lactamase superfamily II)
MQNFTRIKKFGIVNVFLVADGDGLTVIDTAMPGTERKVTRAAGLLNKPITRIVLTHAHDDHVGGLDGLAAKHPDAEVIMSARDARIMAGDKTLDENEPQDKLRGGLKGAKTEPTRLIEQDGELIGSLQVIFTPGHTPGHMSLLDTRDGTLYSGDVFSTLAGLATTAVANPLFPLPTMATWHRETELESAALLRDLGVDRIAPGHGRVIEDPTKDMGIMIDKAAKKLGVVPVGEETELDDPLETLGEELEAAEQPIDQPAPEQEDAELKS